MTDPSPDDAFQVLSLDGGGIRGIFTAAVLAGLEEDLGHAILDHFDLVVGTSTGGIIALGLGAGLRPREILEFYLSTRHAIFPNPRLRRVRQLFRAKYRPDGLEAALRGVFGEQLLWESRTPLVIPSYDIGENDVYVFKTPHHARLKRDYRVPMWAVAMATASAPTYFPAFRLPGDEVRLVDGGVWASNPATVGVTEAVSMFNTPLASIRLLSLGTTSVHASRARRLDDAGLLRWVRSPNVIDVLLRGQSLGSYTQVQHLLGKENAYRLDPIAPASLARMDSGDARGLIGKASHHSRQFMPLFEEMFCSHTARAYEPMYRTVKEGEHARNT